MSILLFSLHLLTLNLLFHWDRTSAANNRPELVIALGSLLFIHVVLLCDTFGWLQLSNGESSLILLWIKTENFTFARHVWRRHSLIGKVSFSKRNYTLLNLGRWVGLLSTRAKWDIGWHDILWWLQLLYSGSALNFLVAVSNWLSLKLILGWSAAMNSNLTVGLLMAACPPFSCVFLY